MIILEGVDRSGKSTLAKELADAYRLPLKKYGIPHGDPLPDYISELEHPTRCVLDRFLYGELPYSIVKKRPRYMDYLAFTILDLMLQSIPHLVLYLRPERDTILNRLADKPDVYVNFSEAIKLYEEYDVMFERVKANVTVVNAQTDIKVMHENIKRAISPDAWLHYGIWKDECLPGIGTTDPRWLFVGERYNHNAPYQVTFWSKSGEFLFRCLEDAGIDLRLCHFTNAIGPNLERLDDRAVGFLAPRKVIALGDVAYQTCKRYAKIPRSKLAKLPHPAYWSRFKSTNRDDYVLRLEEACKL